MGADDLDLVHSEFVYLPVAVAPEVAGDGLDEEAIYLLLLGVSQKIVVIERTSGDNGKNILYLHG